MVKCKAISKPKSALGLFRFGKAGFVGLDHFLYSSRQVVEKIIPTLLVRIVDKLRLLVNHKVDVCLCILQFKSWLQRVLGDCPQRSRRGLAFP
eukprot:5944758-Pleurochrysis_carterae.AAC.1